MKWKSRTKWQILRKIRSGFIRSGYHGRLIGACNGVRGQLVKRERIISPMPMKDPLNDLTSEAHRIASQARRCFLEGHPTDAYEHIGKLHSFLDDEVKSWAPAECKSTEPHEE